MRTQSMSLGQISLPAALVAKPEKQTNDRIAGIPSREGIPAMLFGVIFVLFLKEVLYPCDCQTDQCGGVANCGEQSRCARVNEGIDQTENEGYQKTNGHEDQRRYLGFLFLLHSGAPCVILGKGPHFFASGSRRGPVWAAAW